MIRTTLLLLLVAFFSAFAWKNWFVSLCMAISLIAVIMHPDFPTSVGGIQGANPWNVLMASVIVAWFSRNGERVGNFPPFARWALISAFTVVIFGVVRLMLSNYTREFPASYILSEFVINTVKWVIPGLLLFNACHTRERAAIALGVILLLYFLLAVQVIRWMPLSEAGGSGGDLSSRASKLIQNEIGFNRVTLSMMLAGASWAAFASIPLFKKNLHRFVILVVACSITLGQALTGGRTGYVTWIAIGILLAALRWRKLLFLIPVGVIAIFTLMPSVRDRMFQGFGGKEGNFEVKTSAYEMTSGRDIAWPVVIDEIEKSPIFGSGRLAMVTTGARDYLWNSYGEEFPHPHQAYLEQLLDNGLIGFLLFMPIYFYALLKSIPLLLEREDPLVCAIGCAGFCLVTALMIGAFGGQTFYPREGSVGLWAAIGLLLRVSVQRQRALEEGGSVFLDQLPQKYFIAGANEDAEVPAPEYPRS